MERSQLSLKWLEAFEAVAHRGSVRDAARSLGVSISTVSHHLSSLEAATGARLLDHSKRPMRLTPAGQVLLRRAEDALWSLRKGVSEIWTDDPAALSRLLRIAHIEDFDTDVGPALVDRLTRVMPLCDFSVLSRPAHEIIDMMLSEQVDIGIATTTGIETPGILEDPILRDPFVLVTPAALKADAATLPALLAAQADLPLLRYSKKQLLGRRIEAQLRRMDMRPPNRMEFESTHTILSLVATGRGWTITTALNLARAHRFYGQLRAVSFPGQGFSRQVSAFRREDLPQRIHDVLLSSLRLSAGRLIVEPMVARYPWLKERFHVFAGAAEPSGKEDSAGPARIVSP